MPPQGHNPTQTLPQPNQSLGAQCVNHLANKTMTALIPPGLPFYRLELPLDALLAAGTMEVPQDMEKQLALSEQLIMSKIERRNWRAATSTSLEQLIVCGNVLENIGVDNSIRTFRLDQYVVDRDMAGNLIEVITCIHVHPTALPERLAAVVDPKLKQSPTTDIKVFTWSKLRPDGKWVTHQEVEDDVVPDTQQVTDYCPFLALRWSIVPGEPYGRGKVEMHYSDLLAFDRLTGSMLDLSAMAAKHLVLIRPNATGNNLRRFIEKARNGDVGIGNIEDIQLVKFENVASSQIVSGMMENLGQSIARAFLLTSALRRDAERVTAEEIRTIVEELEGTQGGVYSLLSEDMQRGRLIRLMDNMERNGQLPASFSDMVDPQIIVGLPALQRERDAMRAQMAIQSVSQMPDDLQDYVKGEDLLKTFFIGMGLPAHVRTEEEAMQYRQQRMMMMQAMNQGPAAVPQA